MDITQINVLLVAAVSIAFFHVLLGPDHYLPFIVLAKTRNWSWPKTIGVTLGCGLGHVLSSVVLGLIGVALGIGLNKLEAVESTRGALAGWALIAFGIVYFVWGIRKAVDYKPHQHSSQKTVTTWALFIVFVLGPCEPLIPFLMYPAAQNSYWAMFWVILVFSATTLITMLGVVLVSTFGLSFWPLQKMERYATALAGLAILMCGVSIKFLGL
ncbi:MAG: sulfite exporter TauE/SafE family protein [Pseudomonadota bacterium]